MSTSRQRPGRKGHTSCDFCRIRKLRCDRPLPCTSCKTRGKPCRIDGAPGNSAAAADMRSQGAPVSTVPVMVVPESIPVAFQSAPNPSSTPSSLLLGSASESTSPPLDDLLAELQAFRKLAQRLENRVIERTRNFPQNGSWLGSSPSASNTGGSHLASPSADVGQASDVFAHLERLSMSQSSLDTIHGPELVFNVACIRSIPQSPLYATQLGKTTPCVWFPLQTEAKLLLDTYLRDLSYIQQIVHPQSLLYTIEDAYQQIDGQKPLQPGYLILLLSVVASATHVWSPDDDGDSRQDLFVSSAQANMQAPLWVKSTYAVLHAAQDNAVPTLETIQGIIILSFLVANLEGVSMRYRSLISTGLILARELNLHRIDSESSVCVTSGLRLEMSRRAWWYLASTDWLLAARYGGPCEGVYQTHPMHMSVNKPLNLNDVDLDKDETWMEHPASAPTDMSYFLQRLRLAETCRNIVDHSLMSTTSLGRPSYYAHVMAMDAELDQLFRKMPSYFRLAEYERTSDPSTASSMFIQAYMLNSHIHTQRCKLHMKYISTEPKTNPAHTASRNTCLHSARELIRAEQQLLRSRHPFVRVRLRLAAILYSVFMASIVLLMDLCVHRVGSLQRELADGDVGKALMMIKDARSHSLAAANLYESLMQLIARYQSQSQQRLVSLLPTSDASQPSQPVHAMPESSFISNAMFTPSQSAATTFRASCGPATARYAPNHGESADPTTIPESLPTGNISVFRSIEEPEWNGLFSDILSSSFF